MADKTPEQEPSIEEILASIRQIISDDEEDDAPVAAAPPPPAPTPKAPEPPPVVQEPEDDVLDLTVLAEPEEEESFVIALQDTKPAPAPRPEPVKAAQPSVDETILTDTARRAAVSSMAKLAGNMPITRYREYGNITLEDLVREMLHPMLKDWLSESLPPMVERMVQKELEKLARQAQDV